MNSDKTLSVDGRMIAFEGERNLLEVIRKAHIELPTFCYHSELSVYGACRLCMVDVEGRGLQAACSTPPEAGMKIRTQTGSVRELRKVTLELLLASGNHDCPTCGKSGNCKLQSLAERLGVTKVRFKAPRVDRPLEDSSPSVMRDPNKCVLCGDCVRFCDEIQGVGALDFINRGSQVTVSPAFGKGLSDVECVNCGQCASVCPTGALTVKQDIDPVYSMLDDPSKTVVVQVAPAVRVALGEAFGLPNDGLLMGRTVSALRRLGFDRIYDTAFSADLTIIEEANEFLRRKSEGGTLPLFTSCCPAWVKLAEQEFPELLPHLSSCRSPQQMFGSLAKDILSKELGVGRENLMVVSIMPCTAKKFEAKRPEFAVAGHPDVDVVITTQELARMIKDAGIALSELPPESFDMPFGFKTGAGIIFGNSGGVSEAVIRYVAGKLDGTEAGNQILDEVRSESGRRDVSVKVGTGHVRMAVVHGLANARQLVREIREGQTQADFIEVMACPGGCIGGAGQPVTHEKRIRAQRAGALRDIDTSMELQRPQENHFIDSCYQKHLGEIGGHRAHALLHTHYQHRPRIKGTEVSLSDAGEALIPVQFCVGTSCFLRGSQDLLRRVIQHVGEAGLSNRYDIKAAFCMEACDRGPSVSVNGNLLHHATFEMVTQALASAAAGALPELKMEPTHALAKH